MIEEIEFLKERGKEFWERGFEDFQKGRYNLSSLDFEQSIQLWLKYLIALRAGDYPKIHYLTDVIEKVIEIYQLNNLEEFYKQNILAIRSLEDAYITSRYLPKKFKKEEIQAIIELLNNFIKILENATKIQFI